MLEIIETILILLGIFLGGCIVVCCITFPFWLVIDMMKMVDDEDKATEKHIVLGDRRKNI